MKAIVRYRYGSPDVLELRDIDTPIVNDDDVLVRVRSSSLNAADLDYLYGRPLFARIATGLLKPKNRGLGLDVAGQVEAVGRNVTRFRPGDSVFGDLTEHGYGAFAEYVSVPADALAPIPAGLSFEEAATVPQAAILALQGLGGFGRRIQPGHKVLINGASGNVGPWAVQIAKSLGAEVTGVCSTSKMDLVRSIGADHVIDYTREDFTRTGQRYDRILDVAAHRSIFDCRRALRPKGVYVWVGGSAVALLQALLVGPLISMAGSRKMGITWWWKPFRKEDVAVLGELLEAGTIAPVIDRRYPLSEVSDALRYLDEGRARGKIVITLGAGS
jgi:NADPH:quinone reductase-like Zn-dependent oxidoreductase